MGTHKQTVSLALGSGGARGLAHIGVIEFLDANDFEIRCLAGSSMGALIGGIYAAGKLDVYTHWVSELSRNDVVRLLDLSFGRSGLFKGDRIMNVLKDLIGDCNIEDLSIDFTAVATDIEAEKEVWFRHGPLFDAIRASIAFPTVFTPHEYRGRRLVDGGLVNPLPIAPTLVNESEITIAVSLAGKADMEPRPTRSAGGEQAASPDIQKRIAQFIEGLQRKLGARDSDDMGMFDIIAHSIDTMQTGIARSKLAAYSPDIVIEIPRNACTFFEFHRAREMIEIGRHRAALALRERSRR
ncbi:MAG TPA: patatin-like phospholipase family protein [Gammaproteobacteria bacterium]|nr:patatin-like phospholipase family protein [Gammaproteobacteria bacterium]